MFAKGGTCTCTDVVGVCPGFPIKVHLKIKDKSNISKPITFRGEGGVQNLVFRHCYQDNLGDYLKTTWRLHGDHLEMLGAYLGKF